MDRKNVSSVKNIPPCLSKIPSFLTLIDSGCCTVYPFSSLICCPPYLLTPLTEDLGCGSWSFYPCHNILSSWATSVPSRHLQSRQALSLFISGDFWLCHTDHAFSVMIGTFYLWNYNLSFTHSFYKCLLNSYLVLTTVPVTLRIVIIERDNILYFVELINQWRRQRNQ